MEDDANTPYSLCIVAARRCAPSGLSLKPFQEYKSTPLCANYISSACTGLDSAGLSSHRKHAATSCFLDLASALLQLPAMSFFTGLGNVPASTAILIVLATTLLGYLAYSRYHLQQTRKAFKLRHGCQPATATQSDGGLFGLRTLYRVIKAKRNHELLAFFDRRHEQMGSTYVAGSAFRNVVLTNDPENIKCALATRFEDWGVQKLRQGVLKDFLGSGIFTTDGAFWQHSRAMLRPQFEKSQISALEQFEPFVQKLLSCIPDDGSTVDLQDLFHKLTMDASTDFLCGTGTDCLGGDEEAMKFSETFEKCLQEGIWKDMLGYFYYLLPHRQASRNITYAHNAVDRWVRQAMQHKSSPDEPAKDRDRGRGERYVFVNELAKHAEVDATRVRDETLNILLAGRDTTASLLSNLWFNLAREPEVYAKLQAEVALLQGERPSYETLKNLKYVKYVVQETLRLHPPVPMLGKLARTDTLLPHGGGPTGLSPLFIPANTRLIYNTYSLHRSRTLYGPDAHLFRPERWEAASLRPGWGYLPFGGGPRVCLGQAYALAQAAYVVVRVCQVFGAEGWGLEARGEQVWRERLAVTCCSEGGTLVGFRRRGPGEGGSG
ncbi:hypothetical protein Q7P37_003458 [Cladosporium fusiforme]